MNRINPIYISILLVMILVFTAFKLSSSKDELKEAKTSYAQVQKVSSSLVGLKKVYGDKNKIRASLTKILKTLPKLKYKMKNSSVKITAKSLDLASLNKIMSKFLNNSYNINSFNIKRLSDEKVSLNMEIKW